MEVTRPDKPKILKPNEGPTSWIIGFLVINLILFPFVSAFNDFLTNWMISLKTYQFLSEFIVPLEIKWVVAILGGIGVEASATKEYIFIPTSEKKLLFEIVWNCVGWQSFVMFILTAVVSLTKKFTALSKLKAIFIGIVGTILINVLRITSVIWLYSFIGGGLALVFHDYGSLLINTIWLICFWMFIYSFVLEE